MKPFLRTTQIALLAVMLSASDAALAACVLPSPDGSDPAPTAPNVHGVIAEVKAQDVVVRQAKTGNLVTVTLPEAPEIYTAFGGYTARTELRPGQTAWIWFVGCRWPPAGKPVSAYFQIYSTDPSDKPEQTRKSKSGAR